MDNPSASNLISVLWQLSSARMNSRMSITLVPVLVPALLPQNETISPRSVNPYLSRQPEVHSVTASFSIVLQSDAGFVNDELLFGHCSHEPEPRTGKEKNIPKTRERTRTVALLRSVKTQVPRIGKAQTGSHDTPHKIAIIVKKDRQVRLHLCPSEEHCTGRSSA
jgi:hypothetical protein